MAQQLVNVGNTASDGTGDELRDAFGKINENFTELYSGNVQITSANIRVYSVAGRDGNVVLTVNDIVGGVSKAYVNAAIEANIANVTTQTFNSIISDINAANLVIDDHETRISNLESDAPTQDALISSLSTTKADISYVDISIENALGNASILGSFDDINANMAAANLAIAVLQSNAASQGASLNTLLANADSQQTSISSLTANAASQAVLLNALVANATVQSTDLNALFANAYAQENKIGLINSNVAAANVVIDGLLSNAASQGVTLNILVANAATQSSELGALVSNAASQAVSISSLQSIVSTHTSTIDTLTANAASQAVSISSLQSTVSGHTSSINTLTANAASQAVSISSLQSNAASQAVNINSLLSDTAVLISNVASLTTNAASQSIDLVALRTDVDSANLAIDGIQTDLTTYDANIGTLYLGNISSSANLGAYQTYANAEINSFSSYRTYANSNASSQATSILQLLGAAQLTNVHIGNLYANVSTLQTEIISRANVADADGVNFVGNLQAPNLISANLYVTGTPFIGIDPGVYYQNFAGTVIGDVDSPYDFSLQNRSTGTNAMGSFAVYSNDPNNYIKLEKLNTNTIDPGIGDSPSTVFPSDGGLSVMGGNAYIRSTNNIFFSANTNLVGLFDDGTVYFSGNVVSPGDLSIGSVNTSGSITGIINYTMGNAAHWTTPVTTIEEALDQLALRIWTIENP